MTMTDPIADMLTRVRNAIHVRRAEVSMPASRMKRDIAEVLKREGFTIRFMSADRVHSARPAYEDPY